MLRQKGGEYTSYATHNYCMKCDLWQIKEGVYCIKCNYKTRKAPRYKTKKYKESQWAKAF